MKAIVILAAALSIAESPAMAQQAGQFGVGVIAGIPTGVTAKYWMDRSLAVDMGVGFGGNAVFYGDVLWHIWDIAQPRQGKLGFYAGLGPRIETEADTEFGIRTLAGLAYWLPGRPIELFLDGGPVFNVVPSNTVEADIALGVRFYFGGGGAPEKPAR